jgi:hypothetical protein
MNDLVTPGSRREPFSGAGYVERAGRT